MTEHHGQTFLNINLSVNSSRNKMSRVDIKIHKVFKIKINHQNNTSIKSHMSMMKPFIFNFNEFFCVKSCNKQQNR